MKLSSNYYGVYAELEALLGNSEDVVSIYESYNGATVTFPKKLYNKEYTHDYIANHYGYDKVQDIARHLDLSERRVRQLAGEIKKLKNDESDKEHYKYREHRQERF